MTFSSLLESFRTWRQYARNASELEQLSDRQLADIGISRADISDIAWASTQKSATKVSTARVPATPRLAASRA